MRSYWHKAEYGKLRNSNTRNPVPVKKSRKGDIGECFAEAACLALGKEHRGREQKLWPYPCLCVRRLNCWGQRKGLDAEDRA